MLHFASLFSDEKKDTGNLSCLGLAELRFLQSLEKSSSLKIFLSTYMSYM